MDLKIINCLENLQPVYGSENQIKNAKFDKQEFDNWLVKMGVS
jgi:hypothetical protein